MNKPLNTRDLMATAKYYEGYSRWDQEKNRYETWEESVERVMNMHRQFYKDVMTPELESLILEAEIAYKEKRVLGSQRSLQFGGEQLLKHQLKMYNCLNTYADRPAFFGEYHYALLCGCGVGFSVQKHHVEKLPKIAARTKQSKIFEVQDSIEGWADAVAVLMSSFFENGGQYPEYKGRRVYFDLSKIRAKGSMISGGFKAPGPDPLRACLDRIEHLLQGLVLSGIDTLRPIHVYDTAMYIADAVLSGGVRRAATICLFSIDDEEMINAKTGNWFQENPQRARSNNSAVIVRDEVTKDQFATLFKAVREFGEPGFYFVDSKEHGTNPCVEIGMFPQLDGVSGFQGCNLSTINGGKCDTVEDFNKACRAASILGTLQAGYTNFKYVSDITKEIFEREALIGVSITGWMNNPEILFNEENQKQGANVVKETNETVASLIGINPAARTTCVKPEGNSSTILATASGIHPEHSGQYIRNVQMSKESEVAKLFQSMNSYMVEDSVWSSDGSDVVISFPVISPENSIYKDDMKGVEFLEKVKSVQQNWVETGTRPELCADEGLRHNVSNTVVVPEEDWAKVEDYIFENRHTFSGVSLLSDTGDRDFNQAPMTAIESPENIVKKYGVGSLFASGLIVDVVPCGFDNLWNACYAARNNGELWGDNRDKQEEWIRRFNKFAKNYFDGDSTKTEYCLKDVYLQHKWNKIQQTAQPIDFIEHLTKKQYTDVDTLGAQACAGGQCEINW